MRWTDNYAKTPAFVVALGAFLFTTFFSTGLLAQSARSLYQQAVNAEKQLEKSKKLQADKKIWYKVARRYHKVVLSHPQSGYCDDALWFEGELYRRADEKFREREAVVRALDAYHLLINGYPSSKWCRKARLRRADLYLNRLSDKESAEKELRAVVQRWPSTTEGGEARRVLARLNKKAPKKTKTVSNGRVGVHGIRHFTGKEYTRIVIDTDKEVQYSQERLTGPDRIYFDLKKSRLVEDLKAGTYPIKDDFLKQIRIAQFSPDVVRVVLDFESISQFRAFSLHNPDRLVVDILGIAPKTPAKTAKRQDPKSSAQSPGSPAGAETSSRPEKPPSKSAERRSPGDGSSETSEAEDIPPPLPPDPTPDGRYPLARQLGLTAKRVVIDPGHGGHDPGTQSRTGIKEKDLVLDISRRVAKLLKADGEYEVIMTRNNDTFIPLEERTAIANSRSADLFVSIHANGYPKRSVRGIETFYLNLATTPEAEETAARENAVSTGRIAELQGLLHQIMNNSKIAESSDFAHQVQNSMVRHVLGAKNKSSRNRGVKTGPFYVLLGANMPSILVEVSYLSNSEDAKLLSSTQYRQKLALSIADGIQRYTGSLKKVAELPGKKSKVGNSGKNP
jgi:N-acetylmuramoyl-L-alanine amidase